MSLIPVDGPMTEQPPKQQFHVRQFADFGASEEFVLPVLDLIDILKGTTIFDPQRNEVSGSVGAIASEGLSAAFLELRKIRSLVGQDLPMLNHFQMYEDFYGKLWRAYKEYMQPAVKPMGFDIGFLFQKDAQFEKGFKVFRENNPTAPPTLEEFLREVRRLWHTELADFLIILFSTLTLNGRSFRSSTIPNSPKRCLGKCGTRSRRSSGCYLNFACLPECTWSGRGGMIQVRDGRSDFAGNWGRRQRTPNLSGPQVRFEDITNDLLEPSCPTAGKSAVCECLTPC